MLAGDGVQIVRGLDLENEIDTAVELAARIGVIGSHWPAIAIAGRAQKIARDVMRALHIAGHRGRPGRGEIPVVPIARSDDRGVVGVSLDPDGPVHAGELRGDDVQDWDDIGTESSLHGVEKVGDGQSDHQLLALDVKGDRGGQSGLL